MTCKRITNFLLLTTLINFVYLVPVLAQPKTIAALRQQLDSAMKKQHVAGMMLALVNKDSVVYTGGVGYADWQKKIPVSDTQLFRLSSITKMFTALGILNLIKEGKLSVGARLKTIAPEIPFTNDWEASNPVTIETLLEHTTGFSDKSPLEEFIADNRKYRPLDAVLVFKKFMHSRWKPGEAHAYSGVNYAVLAYVLEKVSGQPINGYLRQKVFTPLGMPYANMHLTDDGSTAYSKAYSWKNNHMQPVPHVPYYNAGYASLNASAIDCAHALKAYLNNWQTNNGPFLSPAIMFDAETPHTYLSAREGLKNTYGYGNECYEYNGRLFRGHMGAMGGYLSAFLYNRHKSLGYAFSVNTYNEDFFRWADGLIRQFLLQGITDTTAITDYRINTKAVAAYEGYYRLSNPGQLYTGFFESMQNTLQVKQNGNNLAIHVLLRGTMKWKAADSTGKWFKDAGTAYPQNMLLRDADNRPVIVHNTLYFKKAPAFEAWMPIVLFIGSALLLFISLAVLIAVRLIFIFKKIKTPLFLLLLSPAMLFVGLMIIALSILRILDDMGANAQMGGDQVLWQLGKYTVAVFSIGTVCLLAYQWKQLRKLSRVYFSVTAFAGLYALWILIVNHWFG